MTTKAFGVFFFFAFSKALCVHTRDGVKTMLTQIHDNNWQQCREPAGNEEYNECVSNGQSIDTANPPFFGGAITNLAQLAAYMSLGHQLQLLFLRVRASFIWKSNARAPRFTGFTVNGAPYWHGDLNFLKTFRHQRWISSRSCWFGHWAPFSCKQNTKETLSLSCKRMLKGNWGWGNAPNGQPQTWDPPSR